MGKASLNLAGDVGVRSAGDEALACSRDGAFMGARCNGDDGRRRRRCGKVPCVECGEFGVRGVGMSSCCLGVRSSSLFSLMV
jgi:hypothetical protein